MSDRAWMPSASSDWRFLPGMPSGGRALLLSTTHPDAAVGLLATYEQVIVVTKLEEKTAVLPPHLLENGRLSWHFTHTPATLTPLACDLVALPHGFWHTPETDLQLVKRWLRPGGTIFIGYNGRFSYRRKRQSAAGWSNRHLAQLLQKQGFQLVGHYGVVPSLVHPAILAPLSPALIGQWLAKKASLAWFSTWLRREPWWRILTYLLPAYGVIAKYNATSSNP